MANEIHRIPRALTLVLSFAIALGACSCESRSTDDDDGGGTDGSTDSGSDGSVCVPLGASCSGSGCCGDAICDGGSGTCVTPTSCAQFDEACGSGCCVGLTCDAGTSRCTLPDFACAATGASCTDGNDCCSLACDGTMHCAVACVQDGGQCSSGSECCTGYCNASMQCAKVPNNGNVCASSGNACSVDGDCCSKNCVSGTCRTTGAVCAPVGDRCYGDTDCCSFSCNLSDPNADAGFCQTLAVGGTSSCSVAGEPCGSGSCAECCSRSCAPTVAGATVCSNVSGCRVDGDICEDDDDCCGGPNSGYPSADSGSCVKNAPGDPFGRCQINQGPVGAVCSLVTPVCGGVSSAPSNCSDCFDNPKAECCHIDSGGTPRCMASSASCESGFDGSPGCCIAAGNACSNSTECCDGAPCLQDAGGTFRCGSSCSMVDAPCANTGDCCSGLVCSVPAGELTGTCKMTPTTSNPDGGTGGTCSGYAQDCSSDSDCCPGMGLRCFESGANLSCSGLGPCTCTILLE